MNEDQSYESETSKLINTFNTVMSLVIASKELYILEPGKNFSKAHILTFDKTIKTVFNFNKDSLTCMLLKTDYTDLEWEVSSSALSAARSQIKVSAFMDIFYSFNRETRRNHLFKNMMILACDGSEITIHGSAAPGTGDANPYRAKTKNGKEREYVHMNAFYDVLERTYVDFILQPGAEKDEDAAFLQLCDRIKGTMTRFIVVCDRGYEAHMTFFRLCMENIFFVIRIKDEKSAMSVLQHYPLKPDTDVYDITYQAVLSKSYKSKLLEKNGVLDDKAFKFIGSHDKFSEFDHANYLFLKCRLVRLRLMKADGTWTYETLMTNLPEDEFSIEDLCYIYRSRWGCELGFEGLKYVQCLEYLHSRKPELISQEIYAAATLYNLCSRIRNYEEQETFKGEPEEAFLHYFSGWTEDELDQAADTKPAFSSQEQSELPENSETEENTENLPIDTRKNMCLSKILKSVVKLKNIYCLSFKRVCEVVLENRLKWTKSDINQISRKARGCKIQVHLRRPDTRMKAI